ncbi:DUF1189 domain-containing protein [Atopococcus tabaci]|uniref:DUF1189 domain-containing protein n=1 Tax=Atopococcus tabaci TaxID=269774 RepID=UPI000413B116|nr:DUF1189 domain-containing protein [Atopococcus tabaci]
MIDLMKTAFVQPLNIHKAKNIRKGKAFLYLTVLAIFMAVPFLVQALRTLSSIHEDGQEIAQSIPDFQVQNGEVILEQDAESFVYQTDTFLFFFDPEGKMSTDTISRNTQRLGVPIGFGVMENELHFSVLSYDLGLPYNQLDGLTGAELRGLMNSVGTYDAVYLLLFFLVFFVISLANLAFELLVYTIFANLVAAVLRRRYRFGENWKMITVSATVPVILFAVLNLMGVYLLWQIELKGLVTLLYYYNAIKNDSSHSAA